MSKNVLTRKIARTVFILLQKTGGLSLKKLHECIRQVYPKTSLDIIKLNNVLHKAAAIGAVQKKNNRYCLGSLIKKRQTPGTARKRLPLRRACSRCKRSRRKRSGKRGRSRSRRRRPRR
ncbi:uncharacterized protein LOC130891513 [Diorhabda carinulata]|uniref:uncharacterized protein LOC130891513 n=1 Tax=Diorhabda carinulata TaxID=1163345 RepID=UPI0025A1109D|nr:uncharacterized protein LOC130891513 [Diorhabda carinulata]